VANSTCAGIDLGVSAVWTNEFEWSSITREIKYTEDGRKVVFQKTEKKNNKIIISCGWRSYLDVKTFAELKNTGQPVLLVMKNGYTSTVLIESTATQAPVEFTEYADTDYLDLTLTLLEI
jgi:hypothetical protein